MKEPVPPLTETETLLTAFVARWPGWHAWQGVNGAWYAQHPRASPELTAGPVPLERLADAVEAKLAERRR